MIFFPRTEGHEDNHHHILLGANKNLGQWQVLLLLLLPPLGTFIHGQDSKTQTLSPK